MKIYYLIAVIIETMRVYGRCDVGSNSLADDTDDADDEPFVLSPRNPKPPLASALLRDRTQILRYLRLSPEPRFPNRDPYALFNH